jgi:UrcA family protein
MYSEIRLRCRLVSTVIACLGLCAVASLAAAADPPRASTPHTLATKVSVADLDLSTAQGMRTAHKRLKAKTEHLCRQLEDSFSAAFRWKYAACVDEALASAIQQLNVPTRAAVDGPRTNR